MATCERERKNKQLSKSVGPFYRGPRRKRHLEILFVSGCVEKKREVTSNSSRVGSTSVLPQGVKEESAVYFGRKTPSGDSVRPWALKSKRRVANCHR
ncbi:hypothetical protein TNCV_2720051 [Trichonephila clavipes]|nr:hypothetical protein TNCV_2720051 [Trichonephila clavipes]